MAPLLLVLTFMLMLLPPGAPLGPSGSDPGPEVVLIDELARLYGPVRFDHALHAEMSRLDDGCAACHHGSTPDGNDVASCRTCHVPALVPVAGAGVGLKGAYHRQCLGCHRGWSHQNGCGFCHEEALGAAATGPSAGPAGDHRAGHPRLSSERSYVYRTPHAPAPIVSFHHADHVQRFGVTCVDCHAGTSCDGCHGPNVVSPPLDRHDRCDTCHAGRDCTFCHDQGARPSFVHATAGWDLTPHHDAVACAQCHGARQAFTVPRSTNCRVCHGRFDPDRFDHTVTGVPLAGSHAAFECARCHRSQDAESPATCRGCHPDTSYPRDWPGRHR